MGGLVTYSGVPILTDNVTSPYNKDVLVTLDEGEYFIHQGQEFRLYDYDSEVDAATPKYWLAVSPAAPIKVHIRFAFTCSGPGLLQGFAASTVSDNGTLLTSGNADGNSSNTAQHTFYKDPTVTNDGTQAFVEFIGSTGVSPAGASGGAFDSGREIIAPQDSELLLKFTSENDNTHASVVAWWYEVGDNTVDP